MLFVYSAGEKPSYSIQLAVCLDKVSCTTDSCIHVCTKKRDEHAIDKERERCPYVSHP
jgi:hypothetical protein